MIQWSKTPTGSRTPSGTKRWQIAEREQRNWSQRTSLRSSPRNSASPSDLVSYMLLKLSLQLFLPSFGCDHIFTTVTPESFLILLTSCRWAPVFWLEVQTSRRLSHRPVLLDGPVLLHEGRSGEREEPGNQSDAGDVKDHLWLQDRWGFSLSPSSTPVAAAALPWQLTDLRLNSFPQLASKLVLLRDCSQSDLNTQAHIFRISLEIVEKMLLLTPDFAWESSGF